MLTTVFMRAPIISDSVTLNFLWKSLQTDAQIYRPCRKYDADLWFHVPSIAIPCAGYGDESVAAKNQLTELNRSAPVQIAQAPERVKRHAGIGRPVFAESF